MRIIDTFLLESKQKFVIYLDLDGVLTNFEKAVLNLGYGTIDEIEQKYGVDFLWKILAKAGEPFWSEMEWMPDGKETWTFLKKYNPIILSAPTTAKSSYIGKTIWVRKNLGSNVKLILDKNKEKYAKSNAILIDDRKENIIKWKKAKGIAITHTDAESTIQKIQGLFNE